MGNYVIQTKALIVYMTKGYEYKVKLESNKRISIIQHVHHIVCDSLIIYSASHYSNTRATVSAHHPTSILYYVTINVAISLILLIVETEANYLS